MRDTGATLIRLPQKDFVMSNSNSKASPCVLKGKFIKRPDLVLNMDFYGEEPEGGLGLRARGPDGEILKRFWRLDRHGQEELAAEIWRFAVGRIRQRGGQG